MRHKLGFFSYLITSGDQYCGGRLERPSGSFKTPNWPDRDYPAGVTCLWHILAPKNQVRFPENMKKAFMCELCRQCEGPNSQELLLKGKKGLAGHRSFFIQRPRFKLLLHYLTCKTTDSLSYSIITIFKTGFEIQMVNKFHVQLFNPVEDFISRSH